jgi:hypothetical protein
MAPAPPRRERAANCTESAEWQPDCQGRATVAGARRDEIRARRYLIGADAPSVGVQRPDFEAPISGVKAPDVEAPPDRGVGGIYDRHSYDKEKRAALEAWAWDLTRITSGTITDNVVILTR